LIASDFGIDVPSVLGDIGETFLTTTEREKINKQAAHLTERLTLDADTEVKLEEIVDIDDYDVAAFDGTKIGLILQASTILNARVRFLDEEVLRDRDDDVIPTELETWSLTRARLKLYISVDLPPFASRKPSC
jgi:hypothetical protein